LIPNLSRVAFVQEDVTLSALPQVLARYDQQATVAARSLRIELHTFILHRGGDVPTAFLGMAKNHDQGLLVMATPFMFGLRKEIIDLAAAHRITAVYENHLYVESGGLMSYGVSISEMRRRGAVYVDKILRGAKPADLPVEQPTKFELVINLKTAKALGLTIPPSVLGRADRVASFSVQPSGSLDARCLRMTGLSGPSGATWIPGPALVALPWGCTARIRSAVDAVRRARLARRSTRREWSTRRPVRRAPRGSAHRGARRSGRRGRR